MSRIRSALKGLAALLMEPASEFWALQVGPVEGLGEEPDRVAAAERESFFWRAERRNPAW